MLLGFSVICCCLFSGLAVVAEIITQHDYADLVRTLGGELRVELTNACATGLRPYGVRVRKCLLTDFCPANVIALSNSDPILRNVDEEE